MAPHMYLWLARRIQSALGPFVLPFLFPFLRQVIGDLEGDLLAFWVQGREHEGWSASRLGRPLGVIQGTGPALGVAEGIREALLAPAEGAQVMPRTHEHRQDHLW